MTIILTVDQLIIIVLVAVIMLMAVFAYGFILATKVTHTREHHIIEQQKKR